MRMILLERARVGKKLLGVLVLLVAGVAIYERATPGSMGVAASARARGPSCLLRPSVEAREAAVADPAVAPLPAAS